MKEGEAVASSGSGTQPLRAGNPTRDGIFVDLDVAEKRAGAKIWRMSTVMEIEAAIEKLPFEQRRELVERLEERHILTECSDMIFQMYDEEEEEQERRRKAGQIS